MNNFTSSPESWHYKMVDAQRISFDKFQMPKDFCTYWRWFTVRLFRNIFLGAFVIVVLFGMALGLWELCIVIWYNPMQSVITTGVIVFFVALLAFSLWALHTFRTRAGKSDGILATKYKSVKGKYCPMMEYK